MLLDRHFFDTFPSWGLITLDKENKPRGISANNKSIVKSVLTSHFFLTEINKKVKSKKIKIIQKHTSKNFLFPQV